VPLVAGDETFWRTAGWRVFKWCMIVFAVLGFLAGFAAAKNGNSLSFGALVFAGWYGVAAVTALMAFAGGLFGAVWLLIFRALALASRR
jgi:hypothetical protein